MYLGCYYPAVTVSAEKPETMMSQELPQGLYGHVFVATASHPLALEGD